MSGLYGLLQKALLPSISTDIICLTPGRVSSYTIWKNWTTFLESILKLQNLRLRVWLPSPLERGWGED
jgi:hypothetical protein